MQVNPNDLRGDTVGHGAKESDLRRDDALAQIASAGYVRGNLRLLHGGTEVPAAPGGTSSGPGPAGGASTNTPTTGLAGAGGGTLTARRGGEATARLLTEFD